jgi:hypothetical protein
LSKLWLKGGEPFQLLQKFPKFDNAMNGQTTWEEDSLVICSVSTSKNIISKALICIIKDWN